MRIETAVAAWVLPALCVACVHKDTSFTFSGNVLDENGNGIVSANVSLASSGLSTMTDPNGGYTFTMPSLPSTTILTVQASGYARASRVVPANTLQKYQKIAIMMRKPQSITTVALPTGPDTTATAQVKLADGGTLLTISPNTLVTSTGQLATGNAQIALTYWHPKRSLASLPGSLLTLGSTPGTTALLQTFGMTDIEISQNGNLLQVANGQTLGLQFTVPPAQYLTVNARMSSSIAPPNLYSLDMNTGLWRLEATLASNPDQLSYNPNTGVFSALLPHLSAWNMDGIVTTEGGCVQGSAVNQQGTPAANIEVTVYFMDRDEVKDFQAATDSNGNFCVSTGYTPPDNYAIEQVPYYVSGADSPTDSSQCNPMPPFCSACDFEPLYCTNCASRSTFICADNGAELTSWGDDTCVDLPTCNSTSSQAEVVACAYRYLDDCTPQSPLVTITPCHFCSGAPASCSAIVATGSAATYETMAGVNGSCGQLNTVTVGGTAPAGTPGSGTTPTNPCPTMLPEGAACNPTTTPTCCATGLVCSDYLCVPAAD